MWETDCPGHNIWYPSARWRLEFREHAFDSRRELRYFPASRTGPIRLAVPEVGPIAPRRPSPRAAERQCGTARAHERSAAVAPARAAPAHRACCRSTRATPRRGRARRWRAPPENRGRLSSRLRLSGSSPVPRAGAATGARARADSVSPVRTPTVQSRPSWASGASRAWAVSADDARIGVSRSPPPRTSPARARLSNPNQTA